MSEKINSGAGGVGGGMNKKSSPGRHIGGENDVESSGVDIKKEPDELARVSCEPHPLIDADERFSSNFITELDSGDHFSSNFKTERDLECSSFQLSSNVKSELYDPEGGDISETEESDSEHNLPREMKVKSEPTDDYGLEPGDTLPPASESEEWVGAGSELGPVPLCLIPAAGRRGLLRIDVEDPLHPVPSGAVKELPGDDDMEESSCGFGDNAASDDQNMEDDDNTVSSLLLDHSGEIESKNPPGESVCPSYSKIVKKLHICRICCKAFKRNYDLARHERIHTGEKPFKCDQCDKTFVCSSDRTRHERIHTGVKPHACDQCNKAFKEKGDLSKHRRIHTGEKPFACDQCDKTFTWSISLNQHRLTHEAATDRPFACDQCDEAFKWRNSLNRHRLAHHIADQSFACDQCDETFKEKGDHIEHECIPDGDKSFACDQCDEIFIWSNALNKHRLNSHSGEQAVKPVNTGSPTQEDFLSLLMEHQIAVTKNRPHACKHCSKTFRQKYDLTRHERIHTGEKPFKCALCDKTFGTKSDLARHKRIHTGEKPYACDLCNKAFKDKGDLSKHKRIHTGEKPFACDQCDKTFTWSISLNQHRLTHVADRPFPCDQCDKTFKWSSGLSNHKAMIHTGENNRVARPRRPSKRSMTWTVTINSPDKSLSDSDLTTPIYIQAIEKTHTCDECGKSFTQRTSLNDHKRTHTGEKPFACDQCDKAFAQSSTLYQHKRTHSDERLYACDRCGKTFKWSTALTKHKQTHTGEKPFACDQCDKTFTRRGSLIDHKYIHTGERQFECNQCHKTFIQRRGLNKHKCTAL